VKGRTTDGCRNVPVPAGFGTIARLRAGPASTVIRVKAMSLLGSDIAM
jgi:hypothetical protein